MLDNTGQCQGFPLFQGVDQAEFYHQELPYSLIQVLRNDTKPSTTILLVLRVLGLLL